MALTFQRLLPSDTEPLVRFLTGERWPFHGVGEVDRDTVLQTIWRNAEQPSNSDE